MAKHQRLLAAGAVALVAASLGGCGQFSAGSLDPSARLTERECLARVMYFESNRSSDEGMLAVGTVVMNRLESPKYPKTVCGVVGQDRQFAQGALTKHVERRSTSWARAQRAADAVLAGERHEAVGEAKFFHTAGYKFPYRNMKYVTLAGGNIFYEKRYPAPGAPAWPSASMFAAAATSKPAAFSRPTMLARADLPSTSADERDDASETAAAFRQPASRAERPASLERPKPVMLARSEARPAPEMDEEDEVAPVASSPIRPKPLPIVSAPKPVVLARAEARPAPETDDEEDDTTSPARRKPLPIVALPKPVALARFEPRPAASHAVELAPIRSRTAAILPKPQPVIAPAPRPALAWRPSEIAATLRETKSSPSLLASRSASPSRTMSAPKALAAAKPATAKTVLAAAVQPPAKPKPVVFAMLGDQRGRPTPPPRSIAALIASDGAGRRAIR